VIARISDEALCVILADIKKYKSAECLFYDRIKKTKGPESEKKLFCLYYNLALMYKSAKDEKKSVDCFKKALQYKLSNDMEDIRLECISELINSQLKTNTIDDGLLKEYVNSEIEYSTNLFETENTIVLNRLWGKSIQRMQRVLCYLNSCPNKLYLKSAFALSVFQQGITFDSEKYMTKTVSAMSNVENQQLYNRFIERKSNLGVSVKKRPEIPCN